MNIGIFTDCYYPQINGVVTSIMILQEELVMRGHNVTIITVKIPDFTQDTDSVIRIRSIPFSKCKEFRLGITLSSYPYKTINAIRALNLDIIHTHTEFSIGFLGRYMSKLLNIPMLHTYHTMYEDYTHYIYNFKYGKSIVKKIITQYIKMYLKKHNAIIAPTHKTKNTLLRYGVVKDIYVVPTGININSFIRHDKNHPMLKKIRKKLNLNHEDKIILTLGRISKEKDVDMTILQMLHLKSVQPNAKLIIVGDGPYKGKLEKLVNQHHLNEYVRFVGRVPFEHVSYYYSLAHVFVSASKSETQGLTIIEAMASKLAVIVYDDENITDIIVNEYSGRLFKTEDEFAACIDDAFNFPLKTKQMVNNAYEVVHNLSKEVFGENAERVYTNIVESRNQHVRKG